jgi:hypothetical protein
MPEVTLLCLMMMMERRGNGISSLPLLQNFAVIYFTKKVRTFLALPQIKAKLQHYLRHVNVCPSAHMQELENH